MTNSKQKAPIERINLNSRTYHNISIEPTLINFFYGKNGVGKSTIANEFRNGNGIIPTPSNYEVIIYDREFIEKNIKTDEGMPGVFSLSEGNIEVQKQIEEKTSVLHDLRSKYDEVDKKLKEKALYPDNIRKKLEEECWKLTDSIRSTFQPALKGKVGKKSVFADKLLEVPVPQKCDMDELKKVFDAAFGSDTTRYSTLNKIQNLDIDKIPGYTLLSKPILSSADTPFADFIRAINATDWIKQGHEKFGHLTNGKCPYCKKPLDEDFEQQFASCFDSQYEDECRLVKEFKEEYEQKTDEIIRRLEGNLNCSFPRIDFSKYKALLNALSSEVELNKRKIEEKVSSPSKVISLDDFSNKINELNSFIDASNKLIEENNAIIASRQTKQAECTSNLWKHLAYLCDDCISTFKASLKQVNDEITQLENEKNNIKAEGIKLRENITSLSRQVVNIDETLNSINKKLADSGFQGFKIGKMPGDLQKYQIIRDDGSVAHGLSEGEKNFIAFLYFYHKVLGRESADSEFKERILVIDDPVSSLDSNALFIVSAIIRELLSICHNNGRIVKSGTPKFIRQMFILTHNAYFHHDISYDKVKYFDCVNFYLIRKARNVSTVSLCIKKDINSSEPALEHNFSPVTNSYAALWKEYQEVESPAALMRVVRQILEYYFIQISGHEGQNLIDQIRAHESLFITTNDDGSQNTDQLIAVNAMLHYIGSESKLFDDGLNYIDGQEDPDTIKNAFHLIFQAMSQEQHYKMMMEASR